MVFCSSSAIFLIYDFVVQARQQKTQKKADTTGAIVSSLFPSTFRDRILAADEAVVVEVEAPGKNRLRKYLHGGEEEDEEDEDHRLMIYKSKPIADLFLESTIMISLVGTELFIGFIGYILSLTLVNTQCFPVRRPIRIHRMELDASTRSGVYAARDNLPRVRPDCPQA